jgi:hypothetical protein
MEQHQYSKALFNKFDLICLQLDHYPDNVSQVGFSFHGENIL